MNELQWTDSIRDLLRGLSARLPGEFSIQTGYKLLYGHEVRSIGESGTTSTMEFETDLSVIEQNPDGSLTPRVIVEAKVGSINTHDAITYSYKARSHKSVFPFLRYGVMLGHRKHYPLPGRLFRHGEHFDFMISFKGFVLTEEEVERFVSVIEIEIEASRTTEKLIYDSRRKDRDKLTLLHRRLVTE